MSIIFPGIAFLGFTALPLRASAQDVSANQLLRTVLDRELEAQSDDHSHWKYQFTTQVSGKKLTKEILQSKDGDVAGLLAIDGHPLSGAEAKKEEQRLKKLMENPQEQRRKRQDQARDTQNADRLLKVLPDAVTASYGERNGNLVELNFKSNPRFRPSSHEEQVFHAMEGKIWLNTKENRLAEIDGRLMRTVKFAGGLLGHLDQGGKFQVKQSEIGPGHWEVTLLHVAMQGKALFFKTISVHQDESSAEFTRIGDQVTLSEAVQELRQQIRNAAGH